MLQHVQEEFVSSFYKYVYLWHVCCDNLCLDIPLLAEHMYILIIEVLATICHEHFRQREPVEDLLKHVVGCLRSACSLVLECPHML